MQTILDGSRSSVRRVAAAVLAATLVAGAVAFGTTSASADYETGAVAPVAGGLTEYVTLNPAVATPADQIWFSVYSTRAQVAGGAIYVRGFNEILRIDPVSDTARRIAGGGYEIGSGGVDSVKGDPAPTVIGGPATDAMIGWSPQMAVAPNGDVYFDAVDDVNCRLPCVTPLRIYKVEAATGILRLVAGGQLGEQGDGLTGADVGISLTLHDGSPGGGFGPLEVDDAGSVWFPGESGLRRVDATTGVVETVYTWDPDSFGGSGLRTVTPDGAAYVEESGAAPDDGSEPPQRTLRIEPGVAPVEVANPTTPCDAMAWVWWADDGVLRSVGAPGGSGPQLCSYDLSTGTSTQQTIGGTLAEVFIGLGSTSPDAPWLDPGTVTTASDGTLYLTARSRTDNRIRLYRADGGAVEDPPVITPGLGAVVEGDSGSVTLQVPVTLSHPSSRTVTAQWQTLDTSTQPRPGLDYASASGTVSFPPGVTTATVSLTVYGDRIDEDVLWGAEWLGVQFSAPTHATLGSGLGQFGIGLIIDDDPPPTITPVGGSVVEGDAGTTALPVRIDLSAPSDRTVSVDWKTTDSLAQPQAGVDFQPGSGTLTFAPGETSKFVIVTVIGDTLAEPGQLWGAEWGSIELSNRTNSTFGSGVLARIGLALIVDDDTN